MQLLHRSVVCWGSRFVLLAVVGLPISGRSMAVAGPDQRTADADILHLREVHLRKLHLVRPDLIPYPIFYNVYC